MDNNKNSQFKTTFFGAGWFRKNKDGKEYVSGKVSTGDKQNPSKIRIFALHEDGKQEEITNFAMFMRSKEKIRNEEPDVYFTYSTKAGE